MYQFDYELFFACLAGFSLFYPLFMSYFWIEGSVIYFLKYEHKKPGFREIPDLPSYPMVTVMVPCFNESFNVIDTIHAVNCSLYPNFEIIAVNDGSQDNTLEVLHGLQKSISRLRVVNLATNQGKATGLNSALLAAKGEILVCIDGDSIMDKHAIHWFVKHFLNSPRCGAVTGNPRVRTRSTLLGRIQVGEFSAIIGMLKRAQSMIYGSLFTISGVICAFRKSALESIGGWYKDIQTEDIEISWKLQLENWDVEFEPRSLCWVLMPEMLKGLVRQRARWAFGGAETFKRYLPAILRWKNRHMWAMCFEYSVSVAWCYTVLLLMTIWVLSICGVNVGGVQAFSWNPKGPGLVLGMTCLVQFLVSMKMDSRYDYKLMPVYFATVWYPLIYWLMNCLITAYTFPKAVFFTKAGSGKWVSPDRGIHLEAKKAA